MAKIIFCIFVCSAKTLKTFSGSRKSSPNRTPVKKQIKVQSLLDPSRLRPPPPQSGVGNVLSTNTRINYGLGMQQQQQQQQQSQHQNQTAEQNEQSKPSITLQLDENEIMSISADSNVV